GKNTIHSYKYPGKYNVTLVVTSSEGNEYRESIIVEANPEVIKNKNEEKQDLVLFYFGIFIIFLMTALILTIILFRDKINYLLLKNLVKISKKKKIYYYRRKNTNIRDLDMEFENNKFIFSNPEIKTRDINTLYGFEDDIEKKVDELIFLKTGEKINP
ncbi:unnamed protein product, partial [marine sediment metagenome]